MKHSTLLAPAILVVALLSAAPAFPQGQRSVAPGSTSVAQVMRSFLPDFITRLWDDLGCGSDPFGRCGTAVARPPLTTVSGGGDSGCGQCGEASTPAPLPSVRSDTGCTVDPFGRCRP